MTLSRRRPYKDIETLLEDVLWNYELVNPYVLRAALDSRVLVKGGCGEGLSVKANSTVPRGQFKVKARLPARGT